VAGTLASAKPAARPRVAIRNGDAILAFGVVALFAVLLVPLPTMLLDLLLALNLATALLVLVVTLALKEPLEFSTFPSLLLFTTLLRLSLNVASTRLVLLQGDAGEVIRAFGEFVVGGDYIVGAVIFLILLIIQFVVITKGATRISEVAARFTLDAMPGKQIAIDADLNAGLITEDQARERRARVQREAEFHGSMDGASKFVRGDAVAGLIIVMVNLVGGVLMGLRAGRPVLDSLKTYGLLTIGDGLVAQIPALLISLAAGLIVTKAASDEQLPDDLGSQFLTRPRAFLVASGLIGSLALLPGLPMFPFLALAAGTAMLGRWARGRVAGAAGAEEAAAAPAAAAVADAAPPELLKVDRLGVELSLSLVRLVDEGDGQGLIGQIARLRRQLAQSSGLLVPPIRIRDNLQLRNNEYRFLIGGVEVARGTLMPGRLLAVNPGAADGSLEGIATRDPTFGLPALWVPESKRAEAEMKGWTLVDPLSVLVTHLTEMIREHAPEILSREDVATMVEAVRKDCPTLVSDLVPTVVGLGEVQRTLASLLRERVPIRNLPAVLEALGEVAPRTRDPGALVEAARLRLARGLVSPLVPQGGKLAALTVDPRTEKVLSEALLAPESDAAARPELSQAFLHALAAEYRSATGAGRDPALVVKAALRRPMAELVRGMLPRLPVLSYHEVVHLNDKVETVGVVRSVKV
jgi:flagellar biosynthesis protein FlhA